MGVPSAHDARIADGESQKDSHLYVSRVMQEAMARSPTQIPRVNSTRDTEVASEREVNSHEVEVDVESAAREILRQRFNSQSRFSKASLRSMQSNMNGFVSEAVSEVRQGVDSLVEVFLRLVTYHRRLLYGCIILVTIGVAGGMFIEGWGFLTSLYVIVQISTTIGYGDVTVDRQFMQLFMTMYVLATLFVMANFLNVLFNAIIKHHMTRLHGTLMQIEVAVGAVGNARADGERTLRKFNEVIVSGALFLLAIIAGTVFFRLVESCTCSYGTSKHDHGLDDCDPASHDSCMATGGISHTWISAFYMSVITVTTVGFGDYTPKSQPGRIFGIFWMTAGVAVTALFISSVSKVLAADPDIELELPPQLIDESLFRAMDLDGDGHLTKAEYTRYLMVRHGLLPMDVLRVIDDQFDSMDIDGTGNLTFAKIQMAKQKLKELNDGQVAAESPVDAVNNCTT